MSNHITTLRDSSSDDDSESVQVHTWAPTPPIDDMFIPTKYCGTYISPVYIGVAGIIGAGKTTLCNTLSKRLGYRMSSEPVLTNPYLPLFYNNMDKYSFNMQIYMLGWRFKEHQRCVWSPDPIIQDRTIYEDVIFALMLYNQGHMTEMDYNNYRNVFESMLHFLHRPDLIIYLDVSPMISKERIVKRGRPCEQSITIDYLADLKSYYDDWMNSGVRGIPILHVNWNEPRESAIDDIISYICKLSRQVTMPCVTYLQTTPGTINT